MHEDRVFDSDRPFAVSLERSTNERRPCRSSARTGTWTRVCFADDAPFPEPTALFILPDHYVLRMLYSQGVPLERLGIGPKGSVSAREADVTRVSPASQSGTDPSRRTRSAPHLAAFRGTLFPVSRHADGGVARLPVRADLRHSAIARCRIRASYLRRDLREARDAGIPAARALRSIPDRGSGDDRRGQ